MLHRVLQAYLATAHAAEGLVGDAGLGKRDELRAHFLVDNLMEARDLATAPRVPQMVDGSQSISDGTSPRPRAPWCCVPSSWS